jgi:hypothetical protein
MKKYCLLDHIRMTQTLKKSNHYNELDTICHAPIVNFQKIQRNENTAYSRLAYWEEIT